jgi:hypothetical protein
MQRRSFAFEVGSSTQDPRASPLPSVVTEPDMWPGGFLFLTRLCCLPQCVCRLDDFFVDARLTSAMFLCCQTCCTFLIESDPQHKPLVSQMWHKVSSIASEVMSRQLFFMSLFVEFGSGLMRRLRSRERVEPAMSFENLLLSC